MRIPDYDELLIRFTEAYKGDITPFTEVLKDFCGRVAGREDIDELAFAMRWDTTAYFFMKVDQWPDVDDMPLFKACLLSIFPDYAFSDGGKRNNGIRYNRI